MNTKEITLQWRTQKPELDYMPWISLDLYDVETFYKQGHSVFNTRYPSQEFKLGKHEKVFFPGEGFNDVYEWALNVVRMEKLEKI
jgi:hypothetical protein